MIEGISLLALLGIAMPLKYVADMPAAVRVVGLIHGILFVGFSLALMRAWQQRGWPLARAARIFLLSFVPLGMLLIDRDLGRDLVR